MTAQALGAARRQRTEVIQDVARLDANDEAQRRDIDRHELELTKIRENQYKMAYLCGGASVLGTILTQLGIAWLTHVLH